MKWLLLAAVVFAFAAGSADDKKDDKKPAGPVTLTLVAKTDKYRFEGVGKTPADFKKELEAVAAKQAKGETTAPPKPPEVDLQLLFTNTSKEDVTIYVSGDPNVWTFELTGGAGVVALNSARAFTANFVLPTAVKVPAGKTHEIPVKLLADGLRGMSRYVYWTGPGEYQLTAKYLLSNAEGQRVKELTSEPVKITVSEK